MIALISDLDEGKEDVCSDWMEPGIRVYCWKGCSQNVSHPSCLRDTTMSLQRAFSFFLKDIKLCDTVGFVLQQQVESKASKTAGMLVNETRGEPSM